jgi:hypothetical protein
MEEDHQPANIVDLSDIKIAGSFATLVAAGHVCLSSKSGVIADVLAPTLRARMDGPAARCKTNFQERRT